MNRILLPSTSLHTLHACTYILLHCTYVVGLWSTEVLCDYVVGGLSHGRIKIKGCRYGSFLAINPATYLAIYRAYVNIYINFVFIWDMTFGDVGSTFSCNRFVSITYFLPCVMKWCSSSFDCDGHALQDIFILLAVAAYTGVAQLILDICALIRNQVMVNLIFCSFSCKYNTLRIPKFDLIVMHFRLLRPLLIFLYHSS